MENNIIWTCTYCHINPTAQSSRKCPRCGRKLTPWDPSKDPIERKPECHGARKMMSQDAKNENSVSQ